MSDFIPYLCLRFLSTLSWYQNISWIHSLSKSWFRVAPLCKVFLFFPNPQKAFEPCSGKIKSSPGPSESTLNPSKDLPCQLQPWAVARAPCPALRKLGAELAASSAVFSCSEGTGIFLAVLCYLSDKSSRAGGAVEGRKNSENNKLLKCQPCFSWGSWKDTPSLLGTWGQPLLGALRVPLFWCRSVILLVLAKEWGNVTCINPTTPTRVCSRGRRTEQPLSPAAWIWLAHLHVAHTCQADLHGTVERDQGLRGQD